MNKKVFITGAAGFFGRHCVTTLTDAGFSVYGLVRSNYQAELVSQAGGMPVYGDVTDLASLKPGMEHARAVIHLASPNLTSIPPTLAALNKANYEKLIGNLHVLELSQGYEDVPILYASSCVVYGNPQAQEIHEKSEYNPFSFALDFAMADIPYIEAQLKQTTPITIIRPTFVYGNGGWFKRLVLDRIEQRNPPFYIGEGVNYTPMIHVEDVAYAFLLAVEQLPLYKTYIACDGEETQFKDVLDFSAQQLGFHKAHAMGKLVARLKLGKRMLQWLTASYKCTGDAIRSDLQFKPKYSSYKHGISALLDTLGLNSLGTDHSHHP